MNANMKGPQGNTLTRRLCKGRENQECVGNRELNGRVFFFLMKHILNELIKTLE